MVKSAVLNPMPMASDTMATAVNPGLRRSQRNANRTSVTRFSSTADLSLQDESRGQNVRPLRTRSIRLGRYDPASAIHAAVAAAFSSARQGRPSAVPNAVSVR